MRFLVFSLFALLITACGGPAQEDKVAKLQALKDQKAQLEAQIAQLQKEVALENPSSGGVAKTHLVTVENVKPTTFAHYIDLQGSIQAENSQTATSRMPGTLRKVYINDGSAVSKGQLIAELDDEVLRSSRLELENQLRFATEVFERQKGLWEQKIGTEIQYLSAKNQKEALEKSLATMQEQMGLTRIYAPISGTVEMLHLKAGQAISPGIPLASIINMGSLKVKGEVPESYAGKVQKGDKVALFFPDLDKEVSSTVTYVSKAINPLNRTFVVECALPANEQYRANMIAVMKIVDYQKPNAVVVPVSMIRQSAEGDIIYLATAEKKAKMTPVKVGLSYNGNVEVLSGLKPGDPLITTGYQEVNEGDQLEY